MNRNTSSSRRRFGGAATSMLIVLGIFVALVVIAALALMGVYNKVQRLDEGVNSAWAQVDTVLQRRFDLIPNLVETVKGYANQEKDVLTEVTRLRSQWGEAKSPAERGAAAGLLEGALGRLMVVVEKYPELKSNENFLALQSQLEGTENRIAVERRRYNEALQAYNTYTRQIPGTFFGKPRDEYFKVTGEAREAPKVNFGK
jgi:LemA protein